MQSMLEECRLGQCFHERFGLRPGLKFDEVLAPLEGCCCPLDKPVVLDEQSSVLRFERVTVARIRVVAPLVNTHLDTEQRGSHNKVPHLLKCLQAAVRYAKEV